MSDAPTEGMHRGLKNRHIQMIALGSSIGTGLFLASGAAVQQAGPIVLLAYAVAGAIIFLIMRMLGEMAVHRPVSGSFSTYASDYIGRTAGFVVGWNWWYTCIVVGMLELTAAGVFVDFWLPGHPHWVTALVTLVVITAVNLIHVSAFGEFEFWFTLIKVAAVVGMIVLGVLLILGVGPSEPLGFDNLWVHGGFAPYGLGGFMLSLVAVTFTFGGIVSIGTAAGETADPKRSIPRAINSVILRILVFYVGAIGVMLILWPWNEVSLEESPFVRILVGLGIAGAAVVLNVVVLTAALSVFNTMTYSGARMLHGLAAKGQAPRVFLRTNRRGVPVLGLLVNAAVMGIAVLLNFLFQGQLITLLIAVILGSEIISWSAIALAHLGFRRRLAKTGQRSEFRAPLAPVGNVVCLMFFAMLIVLMAMLPSFRAGAIALPIWLLVLVIAAAITSAVARRRASSAPSRAAHNDEEVERDEVTPPRAVV